MDDSFQEAMVRRIYALEEESETLIALLRRACPAVHYVAYNTLDDHDEAKVLLKELLERGLGEEWMR